MDNEVVNIIRALRYGPQRDLCAKGTREKFPKKVMCHDHKERFVDGIFTNPMESEHPYSRKKRLT